jgi:hypothetical protein
MPNVAGVRSGAKGERPEVRDPLSSALKMAGMAAAWFLVPDRDKCMRKIAISGAEDKICLWAE